MNQKDHITCSKCNKFHKSNNIIKYGTRKTNLGKTQIYLCKNCNSRFTANPFIRHNYSATIILNTISTYNLGYTISQTNNIINRKYKIKLPQSTIHSWLKRYSDICTFTTKLRKRYKLDPKSLIQFKKFHHQQIYEFKFHTLKTNIAGKTFPTLRNYIRSLPTKCPNEPFQHGPRCSSLRINIKPQKTTKHNNAPKLTELALTLVKNNRERHQQVENFFLTNDSTTIAIEVPVFLYPGELTKNELNTIGINLQEPLTGHIDILQVRFNKIHILDYKPNANKNDKATIDQLFLYALALSKRINIPISKIDSAYFDDKNYYQIQPIDI